MTDLRQAALDAVKFLRTCRLGREAHITALEDALAAPQPEPVAYYNFQTHKMRWAKPTTYDQFVSVDVPELPLYTHPPQRQPLTDEQMREVLRQCPYDTNEVLRVRWLYAKDFARAIEKAHGIEGDK